MKVARRAFLQFTAGAIGGTLLTPVPWKLADDSAIWSQNWSWRPSPERGEITQVPSICTFCEAGCGIQARLVEKKRAILVEGNPSHPVSRGGICPLGAAGLQFLYAPYRVSQPLKQTRKRGDVAGFQAVSWEDALKEIGGKLNRMRSEDRPHSLAAIISQQPSSVSELWSQFFKAFGSPNLFRMPDHADSLSMASSLMTGRATPPALALERASYVLSFGAGLLENRSSFSRNQTAYAEWRQEGSHKLMQVESRCSMTAAKADRWIAVAPGSEAALALALAHVMVKEKAYDPEFMSSSVFGFEDWTDSQGKARKGFKSYVLAECAPEQVSGITGLDAASIRELARDFIIHKNALVVWGSGASHRPNNVYHDLAFMALNLLKGNLKADGLMTLQPEIPLASLPEAQLDAHAQAGLQKMRLDLAQAGRPPLTGNAIYPFLDAVVKGGAYPMDMLWAHECNPAYSLLENQLFESALTKINTLVSFSSYMDETAQLADWILPAPTALERYDDVVGLPGSPYAYYAVSAPVLPAPEGTLNTGDVVLSLARGLGGDVQGSLPWKDYLAFLKSRVEGLAASGKGALADNSDVDLGKLKSGDALKLKVSGVDALWKKLVSGACWYDAPEQPLEGLATASGKVELALQSLEALGVHSEEDKIFLPHFAALPPSGSEKDFPLQLVAYETLSLSSQYLPNPPFLTKLLPDTLLKGNDLLVEVNPGTAQPLGLNEGDRATIKTPQGDLQVRVHLSAGARPGAVYVAQGLGHKAYDEFIKGKGVNVNTVTEVQIDPVTGLGTTWFTRARLVRA
ncbi:MAG: molybdopterin-dependent oxidoreductase [Syntrophobacteraceae bacterium]|jgi:anaerobic selenocysteine-containing dehydrogenase|nr:molybdopterin-dependent oxidoreductase [Syntrophobacteraceae bacterium]